MPFFFSARAGISSPRPPPPFFDHLGRSTSAPIPFETVFAQGSGLRALFELQDARGPDVSLVELVRCFRAAFCAGRSCELGPEEEEKKACDRPPPHSGGCDRASLSLFFFFSKRRPGLRTRLSTLLFLFLFFSFLKKLPKNKQARRSPVVRINALAQRAEYIWFDGLEGAPEKVRSFVFFFFFF